MFQGSFQCVSRVFERRSKGISRKLKNILSVFHRNFPRKFFGCFKELSRVFQENSCVFQGRLKGVSLEFQMVFQGSFKDIIRKLKGCLKKVSSVFQENF